MYSPILGGKIFGPIVGPIEILIFLLFINCLQIVNSLFTISILLYVIMYIQGKQDLEKYLKVGYIK